jgi:hypothetical protein
MTRLDTSTGRAGLTKVLPTAEKGKTKTNKQTRTSPETNGHVPRFFAT